VEANVKHKKRKPKKKREKKNCKLIEKRFSSEVLVPGASERNKSRAMMEIVMVRR
jgi:hypothetical protein